MGALVVDVAFQTGDSKGERVECKGEVVGAVGEGAAEVVFDAVSKVSRGLREAYPCSPWLLVSSGRRTYSLMVSLIILLLFRSALRRIAHSLSRTSSLRSSGGSYGRSRYVPIFVLMLPHNSARSDFSATQFRFWLFL